MAVLVAPGIIGCAGSTSVQHEHHLLQDEPSTAAVYFLRPKEGFIGVMGNQITIDLDGEELMTLAVGEYTLLHLMPGTYDMTVTSTTVERPNNTMAETSRDFTVTLAPEDSVYLLFTLEEFNFWESLVEQAIDDLFTFTVRLGKHVMLNFGPESTRPNGRGYSVESVSREKAVETAAILEPIRDAQETRLNQ